MSNWIVGAGVTGLAAAAASGFTVLEQNDYPGGICASYEKEGYRFEVGGGHWIFGADPAVSAWINRLSPCARYRRKSGVLFLGNLESTRSLKHKFVSYPLQHNLQDMPRETRVVAAREMIERSNWLASPVTLADWLMYSFGPLLNRVFFEPFHERYTAGLFREVAPQDSYKSPVDPRLVLQGLSGEPSDEGYNATFLYPDEGLAVLARRLAAQSQVVYGRKVERIDIQPKLLILDDGESIEYESLIVTAPLNRILAMTGLGDPSGAPYTSVLVFNIGATLPDTPLARHGHHWLYIPDSRTGFYRVGYYSNVSKQFLPRDKRQSQDRASLYIELAFLGGQLPSQHDIDDIGNQVADELRENGLIDQVEVIDPTWIDVAYTWQMPNSSWRTKALKRCREADIWPVGRYGRWEFQGIASSLEEGLTIGSLVKQLSSP